MAVNLSKNGPALMAAYKEVVDGKSDTNWALFTYEGNTNDIRLAEKGGGGLEELVEELSSGKVMYAFCRVQDPNSGLPKYVLVNWTGEGVKDSRKGLCASHVSSVANFLKGAHVTVNARGEQDVEPDAILAKVARASGANFNFHNKQEYRDAPRGPVGSVYQKTNAVEEIQQTKKDDFWGRAQRDEEVRRREEERRAEGERRTLERERREEEERQRKERERREEEERKAKERAEQVERERVLQDQREEEQREKERLSRQENGNKKSGVSVAASVQKANEAKSLISQRSFNPRDVFKQHEQSREAADRPSAAASRPGKLRSPFLSQGTSESETTEQRQLPPAPSATPWTPASPASPAAPDTPDVPDAPALPDCPETASSPVQPADTVYTEEEEEWSDDFDDDEATPEDELYCAPPSAGPEEDLYESVYEQNPTAEDQNVEVKGPDVRARALYDYQAVDDTEITFDPDDIITGIEMVDDGWWRGYGPDGHFGMFPANYVELL